MKCLSDDQGVSQSSILGGQFHRACFENVHHQQSCRRQDGTGKTRRPALFQSLGPLRGGMTRGSRARHDLLPYLPPYLPTLGLQQAQSPVTHCACRMSDQDSQTTLPIYRATQGSHCIGYLLTNHGLCRVVKRHSGGGMRVEGSPRDGFVRRRTTPPWHVPDDVHEVRGTRGEEPVGQTKKQPIAVCPPDIL